MNGTAEDIHKPWRKAISPERDRLQSRVLVGIILPVLILLAARMWMLLVLIMRSNPDQNALNRFALATFGASLTFSILVWALRAATPLAAFSGGIICLIVLTATVGPDLDLLHSAFTPLFLLFALTFAATKAGKRRKIHAGLAESKRGRNAAQIIANLGAAGLVTVMLISRAEPQSAFIWNHMGMAYDTVRNLVWLASAAMLAAFCEATADTVSSEIGQAFGGQPFLLTTFKGVPPGTDGAISGLGTIAGLAASLLVACAGAWAMGLGGISALIAFLAGGLGLFFDSLLGATVERKGWLGNDLVNFTSTLFAAAIALLALALF